MSAVNCIQHIWKIGYIIKPLLGFQEGTRIFRECNMYGLSVQLAFTTRDKACEKDETLNACATERRNRMDMPGGKELCYCRDVWLCFVFWLQIIFHLIQ